MESMLVMFKHNPKPVYIETMNPRTRYRILVSDGWYYPLPMYFTVVASKTGIHLVAARQYPDWRDRHKSFRHVIKVESFGKLSISYSHMMEYLYERSELYFDGFHWARHFFKPYSYSEIIRIIPDCIDRRW